MKYIFISIVIILLQLSIENRAAYLSVSQQASNKLKLDIVRNYIDSNAVLYLSVNDKITDSLRIDFLNFKTDSFININDTMWHYMYSFQRAYPDTRYAQQMIITEKNNKIHIAYVSDYYTGAEASLRKEFYLIDSFFYNNPAVSLFIKDERGYMLVHNDTSKEYTPDDTLPNGEYVIRLKYDLRKKVYYQQSEFLKGSFSVWGKNLQTTKQFNNEKVLSINFFSYKMVFWENKWYQCNTIYNHTGFDYYYNYTGIGLDYNLIPFEEMYRWRF